MKTKYTVRVHYRNDPEAMEKSAQIIAQAIRDGKIKLKLTEDVPKEEPA